MKSTSRVIFTLAVISSCLGQYPNPCEDSNWHSLETPESAKLECGPQFENKCLCQRTCYDRVHRYVVNCTNAGFNDTTPLLNLPENTEVLIFTGNNLEELPWNVLGTLDELPKLRVIDMSNNKIKVISGKSYHHVKNVETLILNFNQLTVDESKTHPRVFSNFVSLLELHLTDAFDDTPHKNLAPILHEIFVNSNLSKLIKLHLEQNEISDFRDPNVFCDLPKLLDIYLANNRLDSIHFNISCLHNLRFLNLANNRFRKVREKDLATLENFAKTHVQKFEIDLDNNPFECTCELNPFLQWMEKTQVMLRNKDRYTCRQIAPCNRLKTEELHETPNCDPELRETAKSGTTILLSFLIIVLISLIVALIYVQRADLRKKLVPVIDSVHKRVRYTSIENGDAREIDV